MTARTEDGWVENTLRWIGAAIFTVLVPGTVTVLLPIYVMRDSGTQIQAPGAPTVLAGGFLLVGVAGYLRCLWDFVRRGRGLPAPLDHPKRLVVSGLYRYVRNPMYLAVLLVLVGEVLLLRSMQLFAYSAAWFAIINVVILVYEEPYLASRFGDSYRSYRRQVGRWVPGRPYADATEADR